MITALRAYQYFRAAKEDFPTGLVWGIYSYGDGMTMRLQFAATLVIHCDGIPMMLCGKSKVVQI